MTYTAGQLRELAKEWDNDGRYSVAEVFRAHASALEELARVKAPSLSCCSGGEHTEECCGFPKDSTVWIVGCPNDKEVFATPDYQAAKDHFQLLVEDAPECGPFTIRKFVPAFRAERAEAALAERDAEIKALNGHAERFMVEREGNSRQFARLQERLAKAEADCDAYLDDATRYSRHLKGAWMDSGDERDFYVWRDEAVQVDDAWWDKEGPSINAAIDASRKPS